MTEQNLSLDEMIELAKVFNDKGKWKFGNINQQLQGQQITDVLETEKLDGMYMVFLLDCNTYTYLVYSIHLLIDGKDSNDAIEVGNYFVESKIVNSCLDEKYVKVSDLYYSLKLSACAAIVEEKRQRDAEAFGRHEFVRQRKEQAIDTARMFIGKCFLV